MTAIINENTASAAELTAGALQKNHRAELLGEASYGKGSMQKIYAFDGSSALKLTISQYQLPDGTILNRDEPLTPNIPVKMQSSDPKIELKTAIKALPIEDRVKNNFLERLDLLETPVSTNHEINETDTQLRSAWKHLTTQY